MFHDTPVRVCMRCLVRGGGGVRRLCAIAQSAWVSKRREKEAFGAVCTDAAARSGPKPGMFLAHALLPPPTGTHKAAGTPSVSSKRVGALRTVQTLRHSALPMAAHGLARQGCAGSSRTQAHVHARHACGTFHETPVRGFMRCLVCGGGGVSHWQRDNVRACGVKVLLDAILSGHFCWKLIKI